MMLRPASAFLYVAVGVLTTGFESGGQELRISRLTVDGGGAMRSEGGGLELSGTIGQPDAGTLTGGGIELTGGFWFRVPPSDGNEDGAVSQLDHQLLVSCMTGPDAGPPTPECRIFDVNGDGAVGLDDFSQLQANYTGE
jgi:hypothetical protein